VIEFVNSIRPVDEFEIATRVLVMTVEALSFSVVDQPEVVPPALVDSPRDLFVTIQTLLIAGAFSEVVTFEAVPHALEVGVSPRQFARRDLR
jgi:hypothetical protein